MKIYEHIKGKNERTIKLFGFPIMEQKFEHITVEKSQSFLGGLITVIKIIDKHQYTDCFNKEIKILGKTVIKKEEKDNYRTYYIGNKKIYSFSLIDEFKKQYCKYFDKQYDDIYILRSRSGESYLALTYVLNKLFQKNGSKRPLLVATLKYHVDIIKMICPEIPYVYVDKFKLKLAGDSFKVDNFRFFVLFNSRHFQQHVIEEHYFYTILKICNLLEQDISFCPISLSLDDERKMLEKIGQTGLNLEKFVFLAPETRTLELYDENFWCELINQFKRLGCDVFVNLIDNKIKLKEAVGYKTCYLTYAEAFALAKRSKKIVSLRSGFTEFLLQTEVPMDVLYTKVRNNVAFKDMDTIAIWGLKSLPFVDKAKIREFNMCKLSPRECIETILNGVEKQ